MKLFIPVVGQFNNIGDTLHRKILISWLKNEDVQLHVYTGNAPKSFVEALHLRKQDVIYTNLLKWLLSIIKNSFLRKTGFIFNPGELTFRDKRLRGELLLIPFHLFIKLNRGFVLRVGVAAKSNIHINYKFLWRNIFRLSDHIYWRTKKSKDLFNTGSVIPDLAFYDVPDKLFFENRNIMVISMRGDKNEPSAKWYKVIRDFARKENLKIHVVSQVRIDNDRTLEIAKELEGEAIIWPDNLSHNEQETILHKIYLDSKLAISDRLHVLIAAFTKGVIPINFGVTKSDKVDDHFSVLGEGYKSISIFEGEHEEIQLSNFIDLLYQKGFDLQKLKEAKLILESTKQDINQLLK